MANNKILPGFANLALDSQASFRSAMNAMAHPGQIENAPVHTHAPSPLNATAAMLVLTLCDFDSPIWLDNELASCPDVRQFIAFHTSAPIVKDKSEAQFAIISDKSALNDVASFAKGSAEYPDRSTTLIIQVDTLSNHDGVCLTGPGIEFSTQLNIANLPDDFWSQARSNNRLFPRGVDFIFTTNTQLACLPRSTRINVTNEAA